MTGYMARLGARIVANGYQIIPIEPGSKRPGQYRRGKWSGYPGWNQHASRPTTDIEVETWSTWPDAGIGIIGGHVAAVDIDLLDEAAARAVQSLAQRRLGDTPAIRIGWQPKRLLVYRAVEPFKGVKKPPIEVLCLGQQFVAYAIHPDTGQPYEWPEESLADIAISSLPAIDEAQAREFLEEAIALVPAGLRPATLALEQPAAATTANAPAHSLRGTPEAIASALAAIPNPDLDYDGWIRIGMGIKGAIGDAGAPLFALWSAKSGKNVPEFTAKTWAGLKPERIGAGSIYYEARKHGWVPDPSLVLDGSTSLDPVDAAGPFLARILPTATEPEPSLPETPPHHYDMGDPGGVLGELTRFMLETARRPQPILALGASVSALGALMGRKYCTESRLRSNLYVVGLADSGSGKNHALEVTNKLFVDAGLDNYLGGNKIASGAGLLDAVHRQPAILFQLDEFGMFLEGAADRRRAPHHVAEILELLLELYSKSGTVFRGAEYANRDGKKPRRDINEPCVCLYGTTTPLRFWNALQSANVVDGSLARFIIVRTEEDYPAENLTAALDRSPGSLIDGLTLIAAGGNRGARVSLAGLGSDSSVAVKPLVVPMDDGARDHFGALSEHMRQRLKDASGTALTSLLARVGENAAKVALIRAVSIDPVAPVIRAIDAEWAIGFVRHFSERTIVEVGRNIADNDTERHHNRVLEIVRKAGPGGITKKHLYDRTRFLNRREREEILLTLVDMDAIAQETRHTSGKPAIVYRVPA